MSELSALTLTIIRLGFLAILWLFVLTTVSVMRSDLFGTRVTSRAPSLPGQPRHPNRPSHPRPARARRTP